MSTLKKITWGVTGVFTILFIVRLIHMLNIHTAYGSPGTSPAVIIGLLVGSGIIPAIMWLIVYFVEKNKK